MDNKTTEILDYLYRLEFFSPFSPSGQKIYDSKSRKSFSFLELYKENKENDDSKKQPIYTIYFGSFAFGDSLEKIRKFLGLGKEYSEGRDAKSIVCGFKVDQEGNYISQSFSICNFVYAINQILKESKVEIELTEEIINRFVVEMIDKIKPSAFNFTDANSFLERLFDFVKEFFPCIKDNISYYFEIYEDFIYRNNDDKSESPAILSSFYVNDLTLIKENYSSKIIDFLSLSREQQIEIDRDVQQMKEILLPNNYPLGKWPSKYHPSLMQQLAINLVSLDKRPIFSVNGPPGTGKTTLVKEIIVSAIVDRATKMMNYQTADEAFERENFEIANDQYHPCFHRLNPELSQYGILVASNNNTAVENISLELPLAKDVKKQKTLTNLFDIDDHDDIYFTKMANELSESNENWGMISARLGKRENIGSFLNTIWFSKESGVTLRDYIKEYSNNYDEARSSFKRKLDEVNDYRDYLNHVVDDIKLYESVKEELVALEIKVKEAKTVLEDIEKEKFGIIEQIEVLSNQSEEYSKLHDDVKKNIPILMRISFFFFKNHPYFKKKVDLESQIVAINEKCFELREKNILIDTRILDKRHLFEQAEEQLKITQNKKEILERKIKYYKDEKIVIIYDNYFDDIQHNLTSQLLAPWTNEHYDKLREELFFEALNLQKHFILSSKAFKDNINLLVDILSGKLDPILRKQCYNDVLNTLFLFVPVLSTSLASVQRFLGDISEDTIGYLILDEAGQATPASAIGAINRAKKVVVLGDPFQVEPVVTIPKELYYILDLDNKVPSSFHDSTFSAQRLADFQNSYGGFRNNNKVWVGCPLVLHRRCIDPMFSISNEIAYDNKMLYATADPTLDVKFSMKKSVWLDIDGEEISSSNHYVHKQGEKVLELVSKAIFCNNDKLPNLYIITPFKTVAREMRKQLNKKIPQLINAPKNQVEDWVKTHCGTIHTFQGKEANEVILLLGGSSKSLGAVRWAGNKPNILNVAITRAKYRVTIIGSSDVWKNIPNFDVAYKYLNSKNSKR